jgi:TRAP-type C4-dicarboxylate transport system permease small subunit
VSSSEPIPPATLSKARRALDLLYEASGAFAALSLAGICVMMLGQAFAREVELLIRGADDIVAWLTAACTFFALGHTFRAGELVRMGLVIDMLGSAARRRAELVALAVTALFVGYMAWAAASFVYDSWKFEEVAQGLIKIPIWIPQLSLVLGVLILLVAVLDELVAVLRHQKPAYQIAEEERRARGDFSETV